jgi:transcriptional regulator with XRE-family HTH domain
MNKKVIKNHIEKIEKDMENVLKELSGGREMLNRVYEALSVDIELFFRQTNLEQAGGRKYLISLLNAKQDVRFAMELIELPEEQLL